MATTKKQALWGSGHDESVEVNQRALIDKVLARYSGEFSVFRELLQNSDDALSKAVEIRFETKGYIDRNGSSEDLPQTPVDEYLPDLKTALVGRWTFKNNGMLFRDQDWNRLKKIAEGNPDEEKIGAFGVGFYSLFSATEEPFVTSGGQWMGFYWKDGKDQLFARRGNLPNQTDDPWTTFEMDLREPAPIPTAFDFTRFLVSSITFMAHLREVSVYFDDKRLARLTKDAGIPKQLTLPPGLKSTSPMGFMFINGLKSTPLRITAEVMNWVYSSGTEKPRQALVAEQMMPEIVDDVEYLEVGQSSVVLTIFTAEVGVKLSEKISMELHRSTKKNPPRALKYELIYTGKDEYDASKEEDDAQPGATGSIFQGLRADLDGSGSAHVFIGHSTAQTTGIGGHISTRFIPTVERESIDLVDRNVAVWNKELLFVGGFLARAAYELEMQDIRAHWDAFIASKKPNESLSPELHKKFYDKARHNLQFFTFHPSTPSALVSSEMRSAFFDCGVQGKSFPVVSRVGIKSALDVRMPDPVYSAFLPEFPVFPEELLDGSKSMVTALREKGMLKDITFADVIDGLRGRSLSEEEMAACLEWWINTSQRDPAGLNDNGRKLLDAAVLVAGSSGNGNKQEIALKGICTFLNPKDFVIPKDGPLPDHVLPKSVNRKLDSTKLQNSLQWRELSVLEWLQHIADPTVYTQESEFNIVESPDWADRVLRVLSRCWSTLPEPSRTTIAGLLDGLACIPTSVGMMMPSEAYFPNAAITATFPDLPIVDLPSGVQIGGSLEGVLIDLGVRKHVGLKVIFDRLSHWTTPDLIKYLISVRPAPREIEKLRQAPAFIEEITTKQHRQNDGTPKEAPRVKASDLYAPSDAFRSLGLPVIDWRDEGGRCEWRPDSEEAKFLLELGLRWHPQAKVLLDIAAEGGSRGMIALNYFLDNYGQNHTDYKDYTAYAQDNIAFVPAVQRGKKKLVKPVEAFSTPEWEPLGFPVLDITLGKDAVYKLGIKEHPPTSQLVNFLKTSPPTTEVQAREWFGVLSRRISDFPASELAVLAAMCIVPTPDDSQGSTGPQLAPPNQCYFKSKSSNQLYSKLFPFVDFGTSANSFLKACGTKAEPSIEEITLILLKDPRRFFRLADGRDNYLAELRKIAVTFQSLTRTTMARLKVAHILVGSRRVRNREFDQAPEHVECDEEEDEDQDLEYDLLPSNRVAIADDTIALQQFGEEIFCAPQEDTLEGFYQSLGCKRLSELIKEEYQTTEETNGNKAAQEVRSLILERLPLFLYKNATTTTRVSPAWLNKKGNFIAQTFKKITVTKSIDFAGTKSSKSFEISATVRREGGGPVQLWLSDDGQVDMHEIAASLCRLLFQSHKVTDVFLFAMLLSTDLRTLRRRGYPVDRILKQQKAERKKSAEGLTEKKTDKTTLASSTPPPPKSERTPAPTPTSIRRPPGPRSATNEQTAAEDPYLRRFAIPSGPGSEFISTNQPWGRGLKPASKPGRADSSATRARARLFPGKTGVPGQDTSSKFMCLPYGVAEKEPQPAPGQESGPTQESTLTPGPIPGSYPVVDQIAVENDFLQKFILPYLAGSGNPSANQPPGEEPKLAKKPSMVGDLAAWLEKQLPTDQAEAPNQDTKGELTRLPYGMVGKEPGPTLVQDSVPTQVPPLNQGPALAQEPTQPPRPAPIQEPAPGSYLPVGEQSTAKKNKFWAEWGDFALSSPTTSGNMQTNQPQDEKPKGGDDLGTCILTQLPAERVSAPNQDFKAKSTELLNGMTGKETKPVPSPEPVQTPGLSPVHRPAPAPRPAQVLRPVSTPGSTLTQGPACQKALFQNKDLPSPPISRVSPKTGSSVYNSSKGQSESGQTDPPTTKFSFKTLFSPKGPQVPGEAMTDLLALLTITALDIDAAISACKEEKSDLILGRKQKQKDRGTLSEDYCNLSGDVGDLVRLCEMEKVGLYFSKDIPDSAQLLEAKKDTITRFVGVMVPILDMFQLPPNSVNIFYDLSGNTVTFNRNKSIFLNLRYYEAWHDDKVRNGDPVGAYTSWYFTLAHGITHNLVQPHNAKHEFYFSSICQRFLPGLSKLTLM